MAHLNYYLDLCVDTYIVNGDAVLLRLHDKYQEWIAPGGHVDPGEDLNQAALREVWEEVGMEVTLIGPYGWVQSDTERNKDLVPPFYINRHNVSESHEHSSHIFLARSTTREINPQTDADKGALCRWITQEELDEMRRNDPRLGASAYRYASDALKLLVQ